MFGIEERIEKLGAKLADAFATRAGQYMGYAQDPNANEAFRRNNTLIGAVLHEISTIIRNTTQTE